MEDLVSGCKRKLACFRIIELKDILAQLGFSKQGKKQDLIDRILALLSDEETLGTNSSAKNNSVAKEGVAKIIEDAHRKMQVMGATDLATKGPSGSYISSVKRKEEVEDSYKLDVKIRCPCGISLPTESMVQCADPRCQVKQHSVCVIIPDKPEGLPTVPAHYYCEICRIKRADPFWVTVAHLVSPVKLTATNILVDGTTPLQNVVKEFQVTGANRDLLRNSEYDVQVWCILLNDNVPFRMHWPQCAELQVNGIPVRVVNRPGAQLLGANSRDDGPLITLFIGEGINKIALSGSDTRIFCLGVRLVKRQTIQQVLSLIPKDVDGELFEDALARIRRCIGGGVATTKDDSDSDLEVIADSITVNLRCPMSGSRMKIAGRFKACAHMGCFDLETFVELNQRSRKWQCPICLKNYSLEDIIIDPYFNRITTLMLHCTEDTTEIDVKPDGSWRAKREREFEQWHLPDGSLGANLDEKISNKESLRQIKQEENSGDNNLKLGIKNFGQMETSRNEFIDEFENCGQVYITMSSSSESDRDDEGSSINHSGCTVNKSSFAPSGDADIIVLSDSDEDDIELFTPETVNGACPANHSRIVDSNPKDPAIDAGLISCLHSYNDVGTDFGMPHWRFPSSSQAGPGFEQLIDLENASCSAPLNTFASSSTMNSAGQNLDSSVCHPSNGTNDLAFVSEDSSLQTVLPILPPGVSLHSDLGDQPSTSTTGNWISLRVGNNGEEGGGGTQDESATENGLNLRNLVGSDQASSLNGMNDKANSKRTTNKKRSDGPFTYPRRPRSLRRRLYVSIDSD